MNFISKLYHVDTSWIHSDIACKVAIALSATATGISVCHISQHLNHYTMPGIQVYVIRILMICPIYAVSSALAVSLGPNGIYAIIFRDIYEAFVIYSFFNLILEFCGGESDCVYQIENEGLLKLPCPLCCFPAKPRDARLLRICSRGVLQFVIIKPIMATIDIAMLINGLYFNTVWEIITVVVYNISYSIALYSLFLFYLGTKQVIKKFKPISKFVAVKIIIFATYYQSLLFDIFIPVSNEDALIWNDLLLCFEMILFAILLWFAFPITDFIGGMPDRHVLDNAKDVFKVGDLYHDVYHNFMPAYKDYALQRSQNEALETVRLRTYFAGNLDPVALEMTETYRGRSRRMAFNSLLRSVRRANLRHESKDFLRQVDEKSHPTSSPTNSTTDEDIYVVQARTPRKRAHSMNDVEDLETGLYYHHSHPSYRPEIQRTHLKRSRHDHDQVKNTLLSLASANKLPASTNRLRLFRYSSKKIYMEATCKSPIWHNNASMNAQDEWSDFITATPQSCTCINEASLENSL